MGKAKRVHLHAILDASGSMAPLAPATIKGFNDFVRAQAKDRRSQLVVSLHVFGEPEQYRTLYRAQPVKDFVPLTAEDYKADGSYTCLVDAVLLALAEYRHGDPAGEATDAHVALVITDGHENKSRAAKADALLLLDQLRRRGTWTVAYVGSEASTWDEARSYGLSSGSTFTYLANDVGVHNLWTTTSASLSSLRSCVVDSGTTQVLNFYDQAAATEAAKADVVQQSVTGVPPTTTTVANPNVTWTSPTTTNSGG